MDGRLLLKCADGALELVEVQPSGGRMMAAADYLRGHG
jgi:methionyl-tRNA formyltransferase